MARRVLVADDDDSIRLLVSKLLTRKGFEVTAASDGGEAIEYLEGEAPFDLVLLDLMMPRVDGIGVIDHIVRTQDGHSPRIIVMTAAAPSILKELPRDHVQTVISKPFTLERLVEEAERAVGGGGRR